MFAGTFKEPLWDVSSCCFQGSQSNVGPLFDEHSDERPIGKGEDAQDRGLSEQGVIKLDGSASASSLDGHGPGRETGCCMWGLGVWAGPGATGQRLQMCVLPAAAPDVL